MCIRDRRTVSEVAEDPRRLTTKGNVKEEDYTAYQVLDVADRTNFITAACKTCLDTQ